MNWGNLIPWKLFIPGNSNDHYAKDGNFKWEKFQVNPCIPNTPSVTNMRHRVSVNCSISRQTLQNHELTTSELSEAFMSTSSEICIDPD